MFGRLATAEGRLHGVPPEEVHFHEVGGLDAIVDVVGTCLALESFGVASVYVQPGRAGYGHGAGGARGVAQPGSRRCASSWREHPSKGRRGRRS